jgi:hypothetical protein
MLGIWEDSDKNRADPKPLIPHFNIMKDMFDFMT